MRPEDEERLQHMLEAAQEALSFAVGRSRSDLDIDRMLTLALVKEIEIIGEAAYQMAEISRSEVPGIRWPAIINMRHRLVHDYQEINLTVLWKTLQEDLPPLIESMEAIVAGKSGNTGPERGEC